MSNNLSPVLPQSILFRFPVRTCSTSLSSYPDQSIPTWWTYSVTPTQSPLVQIGIKEFNCQACALFYASSGDTDPFNSSDLIALANQFILDYLNWFINQFDNTFVGVLNLAQSALYDAIEINYNDMCSTRVYTYLNDVIQFRELGQQEPNVDSLCPDQSESLVSSKQPCIEYFGPGQVVNKSTILDKYLLCLEDGRLVSTFEEQVVLPCGCAGQCCCTWACSGANPPETWTVYDPYFGNTIVLQRMGFPKGYGEPVGECYNYPYINDGEQQAIYCLWQAKVSVDFPGGGGCNAFNGVIVTYSITGSYEGEPFSVPGFVVTCGYSDTVSCGENPRLVCPGNTPYIYPFEPELENIFMPTECVQYPDSLTLSQSIIIPNYGAPVLALYGVTCDEGASISFTLTPSQSDQNCSFPCLPCPIPNQSLTISWVNTLTGNGSDTLVFNGAGPTWETGCSGGDGVDNQLLFKLLCTGGQIELRVYYFTSGVCPTGLSNYCSNLRTTGSQLFLQSYICGNGFTLVYTLTNVSCPTISGSGFSSFTITL